MVYNKQASFWDFPDPHVTHIRVQTSDLDGMGHANNSSYIKWCERAAWRHSEELGLSIADYHRLDRGLAIQKAGYDYYRPAFQGDELLVATWLTFCDGKLRIERRFQMVSNGTGVVAMRGHWLLVGMTLSTGRAARLPPEFNEIYQNAVVSNTPVNS